MASNNLRTGMKTMHVILGCFKIRDAFDILILAKKRVEM
jgi:hypothetical protein